MEKYEGKVFGKEVVVEIEDDCFRIWHGVYEVVVLFSSTGACLSCAQNKADPVAEASGHLRE